VDNDEEEDDEDEDDTQVESLVADGETLVSCITFFTRISILDKSHAPVYMNLHTYTKCNMFMH
jgi:hypothetical protein